MRRGLTPIAIVSLLALQAGAAEIEPKASDAMQTCFVSHFGNTEATWQCVETVAAFCDAEYDAKVQCLVSAGQQAEARILDAFADHITAVAAGSESFRDKMHLIVQHAREHGELECRQQRELREVDERAADEASLCALTTTAMVARKALTLMGHEEVSRRFAQE